MTYFTVRFEVIDTGKGFSETKINKILNSKDVAMPTDHTKGIGLFICRKLVDLMGGSIGAKLASSLSDSPLSSAPSFTSYSPTLFMSSSSSSSFNIVQPRSSPVEGSIFWIDLPLAFSNPITSTSTTLPLPSTTTPQDPLGQRRPETSSTVAPIRMLKDSVVTSVVKTSSVTVDEGQILQLYSTFNSVGSGQKVLVAHSDPDILKILVNILEGSSFIPIPVRSDKEAMDVVKMDIAQHLRSRSSSSSSMINLSSSGSVPIMPSSSPISVVSPHTTQISISSSSNNSSPSSTPSPHDFRRVDSEASTLHEDLTSPETVKQPQDTETNNGPTGSNSSSLGGSGGNTKTNHITLAILDKGHLSYLLGQQIKESYEAHQMLTPIIALMVPSSQNLPLEALSKFGIDAIIPKPINNSTFSTLLKGLLDRHRDHQKSHLDVVRAKSSTPKFNIKVLVAEDNLVNQKVITRRLESYGCTYEVVENGERCCQKLEGPVSPYDLVLMDVEMPLLDGFQATAIIRKRNVVAMTERGSRPIPIIALTANVDISGLESCNAVGMSGFLAKPLRNEKLEQELKRWFNPSYDPLPPPSS